MSRAVIALALLLAGPVFARPSMAAEPRGAAVETAVAYVRALGAGDYAKAYSMLTPASQRYFGNVPNYASIWVSDRFSCRSVRALRLERTGSAQIVTLREDVGYFNYGTEREARGTITTGYAVVRESGRYRINDGGHPYRTFVPNGIVAQRGGVKVIVREVAFYPRRLEVMLTFENDGDAFVTFLPYGRSFMRDGAAVYHPMRTRDWLLTDRQLFLGLRLAADARYTGQLNFLVDRRLDDRARSLALVVAPALAEGADRPEEFTLPPISVPAR